MRSGAPHTRVALKGAVAILGALVCAVCAAQTVYVIDHLAVGVHEDKSLNSAIIKVLPTGTALEVISRDESFVQVRTEDGVEGWVDASYVMEEKPAQLALLELEAQYAEAKAALEASRAQVDALTEQIEEFGAAAETQPPGENTSEALREMQRLAEENKRLGEQLSAARAELQAAKERASAAASTAPAVARGSDDGASLGLTRWHWVMIVALMILSFGFGGYLVDLGIRRRHGGFRV